MHPTNGELRAFLDGEVADRERSSIEDHLGACEPCRQRRDELLRAGEVTREALRHLDSEPHTVKAREAVRRRLGVRTSGAPETGGTPGGGGPAGGDRARRRAGNGWARLARAAAIALFLGTALAAALPGSPVRGWLGTLWERAVVERPQTTAEPSGEDPATTEPDAGAAGVRVEPDDGAVSIRLLGVEQGARIRVALVEESTAGVEASGGARFRSGAGFVEADGVRGEALVEIPRDVDFAEVMVNGRVLLHKEREHVRLPSTDPDTVGAELLFRAPAPERPRSP